jgi:hypothetical protein
MTISFGIQVIVRLLPQQFERLQCLYYGQGGFMKYATEMASHGMIYIQCFMMISPGIQITLQLLSQ